MKKLLLILLTINQISLCSSYTSFDIGDYTYTNDSSGNVYTSYGIGNYNYTSGSNGYQATTYNVGDYTYTYDNSYDVSNDRGFKWSSR